MGGWVIGRQVLWVSVSHTVSCSGWLCGEYQSAPRWCHYASEHLMGEKKVARDGLTNERRREDFGCDAGVAGEEGKGLGEWWRSGLGGRVGVTYGGGVTSSAGRMWPAALLLRGNPVWMSVCVCVWFVRSCTVKNAPNCNPHFYWRGKQRSHQGC